MSEYEENKAALTDEQVEDVTGGLKLSDLLQRGTPEAVPGTLEYRGGGKIVTLEQNPFRTRKEREADGTELPGEMRL